MNPRQERGGSAPSTFALDSLLLIVKWLSFKDLLLHFWTGLCFASLVSRFWIGGLSVWKGGHWVTAFSRSLRTCFLLLWVCSIGPLSSISQHSPCQDSTWSYWDFYTLGTLHFGSICCLSVTRVLLLYIQFHTHLQSPLARLCTRPPDQRSTEGNGEGRTIFFV